MVQIAEMEKQIEQKEAELRKKDEGRVQNRCIGLVLVPPHGNS